VKGQKDSVKEQANALTKTDDFLAANLAVAISIGYLVMVILCFTCQGTSW